MKAFDTVPREMLFKVLARLGFPPKIVNLVRVFHENVTLEVDLVYHLDDDGNSIIIKYDIGVKQGDTLAPVLFLCYIQAVLGTLFPKFEAAGIEKLKFRSMQPKAPSLLWTVKWLQAPSWSSRLSFIAAFLVLPLYQRA